MRLLPLLFQQIKWRQNICADFQHVTDSFPPGGEKLSKVQKDAVRRGGPAGHLAQRRHGVRQHIQLLCFLFFFMCLLKVGGNTMIIRSL